MADDYSNTTSTTGILSPGGTRTGKLENAGDADWFRITLTEGRFYTFQMTSSLTSTSYNVLSLYDGSGSYLGAVYGSYDTSTVKYTFKAPGSASYYVGVSDRSFSSGALEVSYTLQAGTAVTDDFGDTRATAQALVLGQSQAGVFEGGSDIDYFKITLAAGVTYTVAPTWTSASGGSASGSWRLEDSTGYNITPYGQSFTATRAGDYYIAASGLYGSVANYKILVSAAADDFTASNSGAGVLAMGGVATGKLEVTGDRDWFATTLAADTTYWFKLGPGTTGAQNYFGSGSILKVLDVNGNVVATSSGYPYVDATHPLLLQYASTKAGTYYLEVSNSTYVTGNYVVSAEVGEKDDYGDTIPANATLTVGTAVTGRLAIPLDNDAFKLAVTAGKTYLIELTGKDALGGATLGLSGMAAIGYNDTLTEYSKPGIAEYRVLTAKTTGDYYLTVGNYSQSGSMGYTLKVTEPVGDDYAAGTGTTGVLAIGNSVTGSLDYTGDADTFKVTLQYGARYAFQLRGAGSGGGTLAVDGNVRLEIANSDPYSYAYPVLSNNGDGTYTFTSKEGGDYYITVAPAYGSIPGALTGSYTLAALALSGDVTAPTLLSYTPVDHAGMFDNITLRFSETVMRAGSSSGGEYITLRDNLGVALETYYAQDPRVTISGDTLTINPSMALRPDSKYLLSVAGSSITDLAGNKLAGYEMLTITTSPTLSTGTAANDVLVGMGMGLALSGGDGIDTAIYGYSRSYYDVARSGTGATVTSHALAGTSRAGDTLDGIERLMFSDTSVALDIDGAGGCRWPAASWTARNRPSCTVAPRMRRSLKNCTATCCTVHRTRPALTTGWVC
jgi:hypothetical protein